MARCGFASVADAIAYDRALSARRLREREQPQGFVTPRRARLVRRELELEHEDAVRAGERPPGPRPWSLPNFPPPAPPVRRRPPAPEPLGGLW